MRLSLNQLAPRDQGWEAEPLWQASLRGDGGALVFGDGPHLPLLLLGYVRKSAGGVQVVMRFVFVAVVVVVVVFGAAVEWWWWWFLLLWLLLCLLFIYVLSLCCCCC